MESFSSFLNLIAQAKTPLAVGGLIAAALVGLLWQIAKNSSVDKDTLRLVVKGAFGLAAFVVVLGFIGYMEPPSPVDQPVQKNQKQATDIPQPTKKVLVIGTVFANSDNTIGVSQASVIIVPALDFTLRKIPADPNGSFQTIFEGVRSMIPARIWASAPGFKTSPPQIIYLDPDAPHSEQRQITLVPVDQGSTAQTPQVSLVSVPASSGAPTSTAAPTSWDDVHAAAKGNEVKLVNAAADAFSQGNYVITIQFLEEAKTISPAGLWKPSYPKLAASYYLSGNAVQGKQTLDDMISDARDDAAHQGYLSTPTTLGFLLQDLNEASAKAPETANEDFEKATAQITQLRAAMNKKSAWANSKLHAFLSKTFHPAGH